MKDLLMSIQLIFVIDRIEPPWLVVEWSPSGDITELPQSLLPKNTQEGERWLLRAKTQDQCAAEATLNTHPKEWQPVNFEIPKAITLPTATPYCFQFDGPL
ncbi:MAG: hypothetical protein CL930_09295 [Deltaproteobacteria bacterium]|jgi:hypothetical protein|nr:hypothetical protein [Deltaproteobacteria bacterium]